MLGHLSVIGSLVKADHGIQSKREYMILVLATRYFSRTALVVVYFVHVFRLIPKRE